MSTQRKVFLALFVIILILVLAGVFSCSRLPTIVPDLAQSDAVTLEKWSRRPLQMRAKEMFARAWVYWL